MVESVLSADARECASRVLTEISEVLAGLDPAAMHPSLGGGAAGVALLHHQLGHEHAAVATLDAAVDSLAEGGLGLHLDLFSSFPGVVWSRHYITGGDQDDGLEAASDEVVIETLSRSPYTGPFDLVMGLAGLGVYGLARPAREAGDAILALVVDRLIERAVEVPHGRAWPTRNDATPDAAVDDQTEGALDLGLAHGAPGAIAVLSLIAARGIRADDARALASDAVAWLRTCSMPDSSPSMFPTMVMPGHTPTVPRPTWCYGDLGIALSLLLAARALERDDWEQLALEAGLRAARRTPGDSGVVDGGLCHGSAGIAHMFHRLYLATGDSRFCTAARVWFDALLDGRDCDAPGALAGFRTCKLGGDGGPLRWISDPSYVEGIAGIGLALSTALSPTPTEHGWDRPMLMSTALGETTA